MRASLDLAGLQPQILAPGGPSVRFNFDGAHVPGDVGSRTCAAGVVRESTVRGFVGEDEGDRGALYGPVGRVREG